MVNRFNTIRLKIYGNPGVEVEYYTPLVLPSVLKPGMSVMIQTDGTVVPNTSAVSADRPNPKIIAISNSLIGKGVSEDWDDTENDYVAEDLVTCYQVRPGDKVWAWLAPGETSQIGSPLFMTGSNVGAGWAGCLETWAAGFETKAHLIFGHSEEFVDNSAGISPVRISAISW